MRKVKRIREHSLLMHLRIWNLIKSPLFLWLTFTFHSLVIGAALLMYHVEAPTHPSLHNFLDALYWAVTTSTTVGYGDIVPLTPLGKVIAIGLMILGPIFGAIYTALYASALLAPEFEDVEKDVRGVRTQFRELEREVRGDDEHVEALLAELQRTLDGFRRRDSNQDR